MTKKQKEKIRFLIKRHIKELTELLSRPINNNKTSRQIVVRSEKQNKLVRQAIVRSKERYERIKIIK